MLNVVILNVVVLSVVTPYLKTFGLNLLTPFRKLDRFRAKKGSCLQKK
jgi:hypothetical protein